MDAKECLSKLSPFLFWDIDMSQASMDACPQQVVQRVLEYGSLDDWRLIRAYYGLPRIVELCKQMRTLDPVCLSYICLLSGTSKEEYRCYHTAQSKPTLWNSYFDDADSQMMPKMFMDGDWDCIKNHFFGSRLNDEKRGGDIDLLIPSADEWNYKRWESCSAFMIR